MHTAVCSPPAKGVRGDEAAGHWLQVINGLMRSRAAARRGRCLHLHVRSDISTSRIFRIIRFLPGSCSAYAIPPRCPPSSVSHRSCAWRLCHLETACAGFTTLAWILHVLCTCSLTALRKFQPSYVDFVFVLSRLRKIVTGLHAHPDLSPTAKRLIQTQRHVRGNTRQSIDNTRQCIASHAQVPCTFRNIQLTCIERRLDLSSRMWWFSHRHIIYSFHSSSVIITVIDIKCIAVLKPIPNSVISGHPYSPKALMFALQRV